MKAKKFLVLPVLFLALMAFGAFRGRTRISAKIYHKLIDPLYEPVEVMTTEAKSDWRNA